MKISDYTLINDLIKLRKELVTICESIKKDPKLVDIIYRGKYLGLHDKAAKILLDSYEEQLYDIESSLCDLGVIIDE